MQPLVQLMWPLQFTAEIYHSSAQLTILKTYIIKFGAYYYN